MSLKFVNLQRIKSWSLVNKILILYTFSTLGILAAVFFFLYPTLSQLMNHNDSFSIECFKKIIMALLFSSLSATVLGYFIARNALQKIKVFTKKLEKMTAESLHERIDQKDWPNELKLLGANFNIMLDRVQSSFIQLSQFSFDISHELRNPLNNLIGMTELALSKDASLEQCRRTLESNLEEYHHLSKLIDNLLFLARSDHGHISLHKNTLSARHEILPMLEYFQAIADEKKIELSCEGDSSIVVETTLFKRAMNNLLSNALKYTPELGKVHIKISALKNGSLITMSDTGIGIDDIHLPKIFDRFYRVDASRSSLSGGLGLGLAIVKSIVTLHKGSINIESQLNVGTSVHLTLPAF